MIFIKSSSDIFLQKSFAFPCDFKLLTLSERCDLSFKVTRASHAAFSHRRLMVFRYTLTIVMSKKRSPSWNVKDNPRNFFSAGFLETLCNFGMCFWQRWSHLSGWGQDIVILKTFKKPLKGHCSLNCCKLDRHCSQKPRHCSKESFSYLGWT